MALQVIALIGIILALYVWKGPASGWALPVLGLGFAGGGLVSDFRVRRAERTGRTGNGR